MKFYQYLIEEEDKITNQDLKNLEAYADKLFKAVKIDVEFTKHFKDRINDRRNKKQITFSEMASLFRRTFRKWGQKIGKLPEGAQAVINDMLSDINMPFVVDWDSRNNEMDLVAKTVMRKKNFKTPNTKMRIG